jgi:hypothetical protein
MDILIKFPSRERPDKFFASLGNITSLIGIESYLIVAALDLDDPSMNNESVIERLNTYSKLMVSWGHSNNKIHAVNRSIPLNVDWKYLLVTSDDMWYLKQDFGKDIIEAFKKNPDKGLIHFPDGHVNEKLITLPLMSREYYEPFGYVYHEDYMSVYADNEQMEVAKKLKKYKYIDTNIVCHRHAAWGYGKPDALLKKTEDPTNYAIDRKTFLRRQSENFGLGCLR